HQFPTAVDDAVAGYRWLLSTGVPSSRIVIAGDSGGGGLTMATLLALRDFGEPRPAAAVCMSPWVDLTCEGASLRQRADTDPVVTRQWLVTLAEAYLGGADAREPYASPVYADLAGLPPLLLQVGSAEILLDEIQELARRSEAAGVNVTLDVWDGMFHFWQAFASMLPEGQQALDRGGSFVAETVPDLAQPRS
ncbi:MAG: alpha/beta hydrolase, partial [Dehalococcoidia bacterium]